MLPFPLLSAVSQRSSEMQGEDRLKPRAGLWPLGVLVFLSLSLLIRILIGVHISSLCH